MFPDSRSPRRLAIVMSVIATRQISTRIVLRSGEIEISYSTADAVDTATVIT